MLTTIDTFLRSQAGFQVLIMLLVSLIVACIISMIHYEE
jgi:competence protein ComGC